MADILIIGGGVSGLSAGIYAQKMGHRALICEKLHVAGGNLTGWRRGDYWIDNCIHWLTGTNPSSPIYDIWEDLGALGDNIPVYRPESLYTCEQNGQTLSLWRSWNRVERDLLLLSPDDKREIKRLSRAVRLLQGICGIGGPRKNRGVNASSLLFGALPLLRDYRLTTGALASKFRHPLIRSFLTDFLSDQISALALLSVMAHFCGGNADLPLGGSIPMADRMVDCFRALGGELLLNKEAVGVVCADGRAECVRFSDGTEARADEIILTIDPALAFPNLLGMPMTKAFAKQYHHPRLFRFSAYHCAFACDSAALPFRGDYVWALSPSLAFRLGSKTILLREFSHDPSAAPAGKTILQVMLPCPEDAARRAVDLRKDPAAYAQKKEEVAALVIEAIAQKFPALADRLSCIDIWTPATYRRFIGTEVGSFMSFLFGAGKLPALVDGRVPGIENLRFACQWQRAPGGLPIAAACGKSAALAIAKKYRAAGREDEKERLPKRLPAR